MFLHRTEAPRRLHSGEALVLRFRKLNQKLLLMVVDDRTNPECSLNKILKSVNLVKSCSPTPVFCILFYGN